MAIERTTINGDFSALKTALETLVPTFFASVELSQDTLTLACKDADENTLLTITRSSNNYVWMPKTYRSANSYLEGSGGNNYGDPVQYFFSCGVNGAFLTLASSNSAIAIAKDSNGKTAIVIPASRYGTDVVKCASIYSACWGDDTAYNAPLRITDTDTPTLGNNCQLVSVPLYGNYQTANGIPKVFYLPMAQANMRGIVQEVTSDSGTYITNGYLAMLYDAGGAA